VDDRPWPKRVRNPTPEEASVVVVRNETDLLALGLVRRHQAERSCLLSNFLLLEIAHGKSRGGELILRQGPEKIRLILLPVASPPEQKASRVGILADPSIVSGRHCHGIPGPSALQQRPELHLLIADDARHWGSARRVFARKGLDHRLI